MSAAGDIVSVAVERPAVGGAMIARLGGRILLVTGAIPGERVRVRIDRVARQVAFATTVAVEDASPDRRAPFDDPLCGGCVYSHIAYARQLEIKRDVIADAIRRLGKVELPSPVRVAPSPEYGYRMRARLHLRGRRIGFFREGTHQVCDAQRTRQLLPESIAALERVAASAASLGDAVREVELSENVDASERTVHLVTAWPVDSRILEAIATGEGLTAPPYVTDVLTVDGSRLTLRRHVQAFFQGNRYLLIELVTRVCSLIPEGCSLLDFYAGAGLFSIGAAVFRGAAVTAVEGDRFAAEDLRVNALVVPDRVSAARSDVESFVRNLQAGVHPPRGRAVDAVLVDPPRTGLSPEALTGIVGLCAPRLIYVSCDVATLARDARRLVAAGYAIQHAEAFDLFPNTPHVETVVVFTR
jgi:23S rRNA (uracil1939-C5)-methyltransferase